jgi:hypothetical protein
VRASLSKCFCHRLFYSGMDFKNFVNFIVFSSPGQRPDGFLVSFSVCNPSVGSIVNIFHILFFDSSSIIGRLKKRNKIKFRYCFLNHMQYHKTWWSRCFEVQIHTTWQWIHSGKRLQVRNWLLTKKHMAHWIESWNWIKHLRILYENGTKRRIQLCVKIKKKMLYRW